MSPESTATQKLTAEVERLQRLLDDMLVRSEQLRQENTQLRARQAAWTRERADLLSRQEAARRRVEAVVARLQALEQEHE